MAYPHTIENGTDPDAEEVQANFDYVLALVAGGQTMKTDSNMAALLVAAAAAPTTVFLAIPTDLKALLLYTGVATAGPDGNGFVTLASWETIS